MRDICALISFSVSFCWIWAKKVPNETLELTLSNDGSLEYIRPKLVENEVSTESVSLNGVSPSKQLCSAQNLEATFRDIETNLSACGFPPEYIELQAETSRAFLV